MTQRQEISRERIMRALERAGGNRRHAAQILGVGRATLYRWLDRHGMAADVLKQIGHRYKVVRLLGEGSQASVYLVRDRTDRLPEAALKLLHLDHADISPEANVREGMEQEFRTLSLLRHDGLVSVYDYGIDDATGRPFLVMALVHGRPFAEDGMTRPPLWIGRALVETLLAVDHLHRRGLIHRDIKSENVLVENSLDAERPSRVTVMDIGLVENLARSKQEPGGTLLYAAPEILEGNRASVRSDLYAIGTMAYLALTGQYPTQGNTIEEVIESASGKPSLPSAERTDVPPQLDEIVMRLLEPDAAKRYPDAGAVLEDLRAWIGDDDRGAESQPEDNAVELVGRQAEIETVLETLDSKDLDRDSAMPRALFVVGEQGIGKSRFLEACLDEMKVRGWRVACGTCREGSEAGRGALAELLAGALAGADGDGRTPEDRLLRRFAPVVRQLAPGLVDPVKQVASQSLPISRFHTLDRAAALLSELAELRPLVIGLDDLHLADPLLLDLIWLLARRAQKVPLRMLATTKPTQDTAGNVETLLQGAATEGLSQLMPLQSLDQAAARRIAENVLGVARAAYFHERLWELTAGHPLFLQQVLFEIAERDSASIPDKQLELPATARDAVLSRLARVESGERQLLEALAVAGRPEQVTDVAAVAGSAGTMELEELRRRQLVRTAGEGEVEIASSPLREVIISELSRDRMRELHLSWAGRLATDDREKVQRAGHLIAAGAGKEIAEELLEAAEQLHDSWHYSAAISFYEQALVRLDEQDPRRLDIYSRLELACREAHQRERAARVCEQWGELAQRIGDRVSEARASGYLGANLRELGDSDGALAAANRAVDLAESSGDGRAISLANKSLALILWVSWRKREALAPLWRALELARTSRDSKGQAYTLQDVALLQAVIGKAQTGLDAAAESQRLFRESGDEVWPILARSNEALILSYLGDLPGAIALLQQTITRLRELEAAVPLDAPLENLVWLLNRSGRYTEALEAGQQLVDHATRFGRHSHRISGLLALGEAFYQLDERDKARDHHRLAFKQAAVLGEERQRLFAGLARVRDQRVDDRLEAAAELAREIHEKSVRETAVRQRVLAGLELARIALEEGDTVVAQHWLDDAESASQAPSEDAPALRAALLCERTRAWRESGQISLAIACADEGLALARHHGSVETELQLLELQARLHDDQENTREAARSYSCAAARVTQVVDGLSDAVHRARYAGRPDRAALLETARRRAAETGDQSDSVPRGLDALASLYAVSRSVAAVGDLEPLFEKIVSLAVERSGAERGMLLLSARDGSLSNVAAVGAGEETEKDAIRISRSALEKSDEQGALLISDVRQDPELGTAPSVRAYGIRSIMCVPLRVGEETRGTLYVDTTAANALFSSSDLGFLQALADQAAIAIAYGELVGSLTRERDALKRSAASENRYGEIIGRSVVMREVFSLIDRVAASDVPVLIQGESGTGKELVAKAVHSSSGRPGDRFFSENCAALPETLLESTLFGHVQGAFTGADRDRPGLFALADGGTLFLDEIGDMSGALQSKLLRVLQEKEFRPVGGMETISTDVRIVAATHRDLPALVQREEFRQDLYFRLNGVTIQLPALRERREDIPLLIGHFLSSAARAEGRAVPELSPAVLRVLMAHDWPGNVRELENAIRRLLLFADGDLIEASVLATDPELSELLPRRSPRSREESSSVDDEVAREVQELREALSAADGNKAEAAALLGISRATLYRRIKRLELGGRR